jgi:hypothetical protein
MKEKIKKELKSFLIFILIGAGIGIVWGLLRGFEVIPPPENEKEFNWWLAGGIIIGGGVLSVGSTALMELAKKHSKKFEIEDKDERSNAIMHKAGFAAWVASFGALSFWVVMLLLMGYEPSVFLVLGSLGGFGILYFIGAYIYYERKM